MHIEILCTGEELLTGLTADTNSPYFQGRLLEVLGQKVARTTVVGDVAADIEEALSAALQRSDVVLMSGGLGPTADDRTAACVAKVAGAALEESAEVLEHIEKLFSKRGRTVSASNRKQAQLPKGASAFVHPVGTAPMFSMTIGQCLLFCTAGVPKEYRHWVDARILPDLEAHLRQQGEVPFRALRLLKTIGLPESQMDDWIQPLAEKYPAVEFGTRTHLPENHVKLVATAKTREAAEALVEQVAQACRQVLGKYVFAEGDETLAGTAVKALMARGHTVSAAESVTGGGVARALTAVPGASAAVKGGVVAYQEAMKTEWLGVNPELLASEGPVSEAVVRAMAEGVRMKWKTDWAVSTSGYAGPGGDPSGKIPKGTVWFAVAGPEGTHAEKFAFPFDRERNRDMAVGYAADFLRRAVLGLVS